jgi:flavin-dependent dehydrogenase
MEDRASRGGDQRAIDPRLGGGPGVRSADPALILGNGSRVGVIGSGPAGSLFAYFLLEMADRAGLSLDVDIYEPRSFGVPGPAGCNMCGGIISETLVQSLAADGILLSPEVVQRGMDSYVFHTDVGTVRIATPTAEKRIAAVHRGGGPRDATNLCWESFDLHLQRLAIDRGARVVNSRIDDVLLVDGLPTLVDRAGERHAYDLLAVAAGVNTPILKVFEGLGLNYHKPTVTKTLIREYRVGAELMNQYLGCSMHVFLLPIPRLEFAALIPKGDYVTMCLVGEDLDNALGDAFASASEVRQTMPPGWDATEVSCQCLPRINLRGVARPYADRVVFVGDSGVTRLYKDGIGAAYRTAKAAARTAVFEGIGAADFEAHYRPLCQAILDDNAVGRLAFLFTRVAKGISPLRRLLVLVTAREQAREHGAKRLSGVLWDIFSGSAPYKEILWRMLRPGLMAEFARSLPEALVRRQVPVEERP